MPPGAGCRFSPWHLLLAPIALVMVTPLVWMLLTSLETLGRGAQFPPTSVPSTHRTGTTTRRPATTRRSGAGSLNTHDRRRSRGASATWCSAASPATRSRGIRFVGRGLLFIADAGDADGAVPGGDDPDVPDRPRTSG